MSTKSSIDFGSIVLGKAGVADLGRAEFESKMGVERMRLQVLAGKRLAREAERARIHVEREVRTRIQFQALREKRAEEHRVEVQRMEARRQYQKHLERHRQEKLRLKSKGPAQENRLDFQRLEAGREADKAAPESGSSSRGLLQIQDSQQAWSPSALERALLQLEEGSDQNQGQVQCLQTTEELTPLEQDLLRPGPSPSRAQDQHQHQALQQSRQASDSDLQQIRERRYYTSTYFGF
jgi:hypothetical protein